MSHLAIGLVARLGWLGIGLDTEGEDCGVMKALLWGEGAAAGLVTVLGEAAVAWSEAGLSVTASNLFTVSPSP